MMGIQKVMTDKFLDLGFNAFFLLPGGMVIFLPESTDTQKECDNKKKINVKWSWHIA